MTELQTAEGNQSQEEELLPETMMPEFVVMMVIQEHRMIITEGQEAE